VKKSADPASTVDAEAGTADATIQAELGLVLLGGPSGSTPLSLRWDNTQSAIIGRDEDCAIELADPAVSRRHAQLERAPGSPSLSITDLGSRNGTRVNGKIVQHARLRSNDVLRVGGSIFVVTESPGAFGEVAPGLFGGSALARALLPLHRAAKSDLPIVLEGETGTGKEVVTRAVHGWSGRSGPLLAINCAALPVQLAEAELFGYRRGAFTGADRASLGFFRSAEGGTLLLDEISDLPLALQAKLLRALEQKEVQPLGEPRPVPIDVRIVVAGQEPLLEAVKKQRFRADLLARLSGFSLVLPPLRKRREDVVPLFSHFVRELRNGELPELEPELIERLTLHDFPFNVRELLLLARRLAVFQGGETVLRARDLPEGVGVLAVRVPSRPVSPIATAETAPPRAASGAPAPVELEQLMNALRASDGNVTRAAAELGITRQRAYRLLEGQGVDLAELSGKTRPKRG
jgi:DNA-binding NtrC family response regulator